VKAADVTKVLHSRAFLAFTVVVMVLSAFYACDLDMLGGIAGGSGLIFSSPDKWIPSDVASFWVNLGVNLLIIALMIYINKVYNIPRTITLIYASFYAVMQTATPEISARFCSGTLLCVVVSGCLALMFSVYSNPMAIRRVFLVFFILSTALASQYAIVFYLPVFAIACAQMRIFTIRTLLAVLIGIITPWWIMLGLGVVTFEDFRLPCLSIVFSSASGIDAMIIVITAGLTILIAAIAYVLSVLKLMTYNARTRACNGALNLASVFTVIAMAVDFTNFLTYLPLLNFCAAFQLSHAFVIRNTPRAWISISLIVSIYLALYIWRIFV